MQTARTILTHRTVRTGGDQGRWDIYMAQIWYSSYNHC